MNNTDYNNGYERGFKDGQKDLIEKIDRAMKESTLDIQVDVNEPYQGYTKIGESAGKNYYMDRQGNLIVEEAKSRVILETKEAKLSAEQLVKLNLAMNKVREGKAKPRINTRPDGDFSIEFMSDEPHKLYDVFEKPLPDKIPAYRKDTYRRILEKLRSNP